MILNVTVIVTRLSINCLVLLILTVLAIVTGKLFFSSCVIDINKFMHHLNFSLMSYERQYHGQ